MKLKRNIISGVAALAVFLVTVIAGQATVRIGAGTDTDGDFTVQFAPVQPVVQVGEKIRFKVEGTKKFYLYLFSISEEGEGIMLLPNTLQQYHVYEPNKDYVVPEKDVEFVSDKPGVEEIIMVATTKKLQLDHGKYKAAGKFFSAKSDVIEHDVKSLRVRSREQKAQQVVQTVKLVVTGKAAAAAPVAPEKQEVTPFVACNKASFKDGEKITIIYGADKPGYVYLWYVAEKGKPEFLKKEKVDGEHFNQLAGVAEAPFGNHTLVAVWDEKGELKENAIDLSDAYAAKSAGESQLKGIALVEKPENFATYQLNISK